MVPGQLALKSSGGAGKDEELREPHHGMHFIAPPFRRLALVDGEWLENRHLLVIWAAKRPSRETERSGDYASKLFTTLPWMSVSRKSRPAWR